LERKGDIDRAIADYSRAIEINPTYAQNFTSRGLDYLLKGQPQMAIDDLQNSIRIDDHQTSVLIGLGQTYAKTKALASAKAMFDRAIELDPISPEAYFQRGRLMESMGNLDQASSDYTKALLFNPDLKPAKEAKAELSKKTVSAQPAAKVETPTKPSGRLNRVALVIGNSNYARVPSLPNAVNDAAMIAEAFRKIGFRQVIEVENQGREGLLTALRNFRDLADNAEWAVIYFAGHGTEIDGTNYFVPTDAKLFADRDVPDEARFLWLDFLTRLITPRR
jgi:tetratricopeptide (TPR) repeat protein